MFASQVPAGLAVKDENYVEAREQYQFALAQAQSVNFRRAM